MRPIGPMAACLLAAAAAGEGHAVQSIQEMALRPGMPALQSPAVAPLSQRVPEAAAGEKSLDLVPDVPYRWVVSPGVPFAVTASGQAVAGAERAVLTVWDWQNRPVAQARFAVPFQSRLRFGVAGRGTYLLTLDALRGEECTLRLLRSFSVCPSNVKRREPWRQSGFWVGQCSFPGRFGGPSSPPGFTEAQTRDLDAELVARMGAQLARTDWPITWPAPDGSTFDFAAADPCVDAFASRGLPVVAHLFAFGGPVDPKYQAELGQNFRYPIVEQPYRRFVRQIAERYGARVAYFQVHNEPDLPINWLAEPEEFATLVRWSAEEVRATAPGALVTNGGYTLVDREKVRRIAAGVRGVTDFVAYHYHGDLPGLKAQLAAVRQMHRDLGYDRPCFANTEMGMAMPYVESESAAAASIVQKLFYCWAHGDEGVLLYSSREPVYGNKELCRRQWGWRTPDYGFVDYFFCPRPVYGAASALLDRYAGARFERILLESDNLHAYAFRQGSRRLVAFFALGEPAPLTLSGGGPALLIDPMGNATPLPDARPVRVQAGAYPQTVLFEGAEPARLVPQGQ